MITQDHNLRVGLFLILMIASGLNANALEHKADRRRLATPAHEPKALLTLEELALGSEKWAGSAPTEVRWSADGSKLDFMWNPERGDHSQMYELDVHAVGAQPHIIPDGEVRWLSSNPGVRNKLNTLKVYAFHGDLYLHNLRTGETRIISQTADQDVAPRFSFDQRCVVFERGENLFEWMIESGETRQLTNFRRGLDPEETPVLSQQDLEFKERQNELFGSIRQQEKSQEEQQELARRERGPFPDATYLKQNEKIYDLQLSPDGRFVTFVQFDFPPEPKFIEMPKYVTESGYVELEKLVEARKYRWLRGLGDSQHVYVGAPQPTEKLGIMRISDGKSTYVDMGLGERAYSFQLPYFHKPGDVYNPEAYTPVVAWSEDGKHGFCVLRAQNNKDRWIALLDLDTAKAKIIDTDHDDAWIVATGPYGWLGDNQTIWFRSERDGYFQLYTISIAGGPARALTSGKWEITDAQLSKDRSTFFLTTSEINPGERQFYTMPSVGGTRERITLGEGVYEVTPSPDEKWLALIYSKPDAPDDLYIMENRPGAPMRRLTDSYSNEFESYPWSKFDIVTIPDGDNHLLYARLYKPAHPNPLRPALVRVHGSGYEQSVYKSFGDIDTTAFINFLLQTGYTVLDLDYRGSSGYGRDCRIATYRNMGGKDADSAVTAAHWLAATQNIDSRRIGIWGGSYGGFLTLMALFKHPGVFAAGVAWSPVSDFAYEVNGWADNMLNFPSDDPEAYRRSSPIYYAAGLQDRLLILHGMEDRNVTYQETVRLVQRLIELKKTGWELDSLPIEDHEYRTDSGRLYAYRRTFDLFEKILNRPLSSQK
jgi:dipeptidyl aminopeptidase/acylaminoacyl peptidase